MIGGATAFKDFQRLVAELKDWGFEVRQNAEYGEFSLHNFVCSYRFFGVLDIDFLVPGQGLAQKGEPDLLFGWDGCGWREITSLGVAEVQLSNVTLFNRCLKRINYQVGESFGFSPNMCIRA